MSSSEIDYSQAPVTYAVIESFTQGVEIQNLARRRAVSTLPIIYTGNSDFSIEQQDFGIVAFEDQLTPFQDKRGRILPAEKLNIGWKSYEETQSYHSEDLSTANGLIEPLAIRSLLTSNNAEIPGERTIKGDVGLLSVNSRPSPIQEDWYDVRERGDSGNAFFDAQDQFSGVSVTGFSGGSAPQAVAFNDSQTVSSVHYTGRYFSPGGEFGSFRKTHGRGFTYDNSDVGTDSLAYGGLKR
jgi:hypothetical protein